MKIPSLIFGVLGSLVLVAPVSAQPTALNTPAVAPAEDGPTFTEEQLMELYGWMVGSRMNLAELEFTPAQIEAMARGMILSATGQQPDYDVQAIGPQLQQLLEAKQTSFLRKLRDHNLAEARALFEQLRQNPAVRELPGSTGARYEVLTEGQGPKAQLGQVATIHYTGSFINGQVFDTSRQAPEGQTAEPVGVLVQEGALIDGMAQALLAMPVGSTWRIFIPPHLACGDDGSQGIPPGATLIFEVELFEVADAPEAPAGE